MQRPHGTIGRVQRCIARWRGAGVLAVLAALAGASPCEAQWVVSAYGGAMHTDASDMRIEQPSTNTTPTFPDVRFRSASLESPIYYGYRLGRRVVSWVFVEGELIHGKVFVRGRAPDGAGAHNGQPEGRAFRVGGGTIAISHGLNFILANAAVRHRIARLPLTVTARIGAGPMLPHPRSR